MLLDDFLEFADDTSVAAAAGTAVIGDVVDLGGTGDYAIGEDLWCVVQTGSEEIITGGSAGTIQFYLVSDSLSTLGAGVLASCTQHWASGALVSDDAAANDDKLNVGGIIGAFKMPSGTYERYLGILCTIATTTVTAGKINAFLTKDYAKWVAVPDATN